MRPVPDRRRTLLRGDATGRVDQRLLLVTKLAAPPIRADLTPRPRLVDLLDQSPRSPLTLIAAPAGFGKTTLLCAWLAQAPLTAAWVSLEQSDDDLIRFWTYVFTALERVQPGSGETALALLEGSHLKPAPSIEGVLTAWINGLAERHDDIVIALDDYHLITAPAIHRAVAYLVEHGPPRLSLIIATRADPPLPLARLRAGGRLVEIRAADLRFTPEEALAFITQSLGRPLSSEEIAALHARTEGWIAGLQLAALSMRGRADAPAFIAAFSGGHQYIVDYLVQEVLAQQPAAIQTFLLRTAILDRLHESLCAAVLGESVAASAAGQTMLEQVAGANLFLTPLDEERVWYRYHPLFAEALRHRLQRDEHGLVPELHRRASDWYEGHEMTGEAVRHALTAEDFERAARLVERAAEGLVKRGELATLRSWLEALPSVLVRSRPELCLWRAWLLVQNGLHDDAELLLQDLARAASGDPTPSGPDSTEPAPPAESVHAPETAGRIAAIRAYSAFRRGDAPAVIAFGHQALARLPRDRTARGLVAWNLGIAYLWHGDFTAAAATLTEARDMSLAAGNTYVAFMATFELAQTQTRQGRLSLAEQSYLGALDLGDGRGAGLAATGPALVGRGDLQREWNQLDLAEQSLRAGIAHCRQTANVAISLLGQITLARVRLAQGDPTEARALMRTIEQNLRAPQLPPLNLAVIASWQARLALALGDLAPAGRWALDHHLSPDDDLSPPVETVYLTFARVLIAQGRLDAARALLERLLALAETQGRMGNALETLVLQVMALQASGAEAEALDRLRRALELAEPEGYVRLFLDEGAPMTRLLSRLRALSHGAPAGGGWTPYRERLLALLSAPASDAAARPTPTAPGAYPLIEALSQRELAVLQLIVAGCSNKEIAERLVLALSTVKWYINIIYGKLQAPTRTKAIARARELNLVS